MLERRNERIKSLFLYEKTLLGCMLIGKED